MLRTATTLGSSSSQPSLGIEDTQIHRATATQTSTLDTLRRSRSDVQTPATTLESPQPCPTTIGWGQLSQVDTSKTEWLWTCTAVNLDKLTRGLQRVRAALAAEQMATVME